MSEAPASRRVRVAVEAPQHSGLTGPLDYLGPQDLTPGTLVHVTLGRRDVMGLVWDDLPDGVELPEDERLPESELRPVGEALDALPPLSDRWRRLVEFAASYYQRSVGELALAVLPPQLRDLDAKQLQARLKKLDKADAAAAAQVAATLSACREPSASAAISLGGHIAVSRSRKLTANATTVAQNTDINGEKPYTMKPTIATRDRKWNQNLTASRSADGPSRASTGPPPNLRASISTIRKSER